MPLFFDQGLFALGVAVGVLGLVLALSLIVSYAYEERTLLALAGYMALMVAASFGLARADVNETLAVRVLLVTGPALVSGLLLWLLKNRQPTRAAKVFLGLVLAASVALAVVNLSAPESGTARAGNLLWFVVLLGFSIYMVAKSWHTAGPWKWWVLLGHWAGLAVSLLFLAARAQAAQTHWPLVLMLLFQVPPIYLSLVWRSRLLNESRLRSFWANVTDPLTGLATTNVLVERLMRVMSRSQQGAAGSALFLIEVKNWQGLLNQLGAEFNEKMLLEAALRLRRPIGDNDLAVRISGGRFAVLAQGLSGAEEINALATRLVVSGLRIDSPLLSGVEFHFRVIVSDLKASPPLALAATQAWLTALTEHFKRWPGSHRSRSILIVANSGMKPPDGPKIDSEY